MNVLPPGTLLQLIYLRERLRGVPPGRFIEIGPGAGEITGLLLDGGWTGRSYDLSGETVAALRERFASAVAAGRFEAVHGDYLLSPAGEPADLVISCMVMEHLDDEAQSAFMRESAGRLARGGMMISLVPGSPADWGIEDDIAGHCRRYTRAEVQRLANIHHWQLQPVAGLTFPLSNLLLPISNFLVRRAERNKLSLPALERTMQSGRRSVRFKTHFPAVLALVLNRFTLFPLHLVQKLFSRSERALVLYFECRPAGESGTWTSPPGTSTTHQAGFSP